MYNLTPADLEIQARARTLVDELIPHEEEAEAHEGELPAAVTDRIRERTLALGLHATNMPKELGGGGCSMLQQVLVQEQGGRATNALGWVLGTPPSWFPPVATPEQIDKYVVPGIRAEKEECYAITEEGAGSDVDAITASRGRLAAIGEVRDRLSPELAAPRAAVAAIGDTEGAGRLAEVIATGRARQAELWGTLCALADDEDAPDAVRALAALERDAVAGRASAEAAAVSAQIAPLCEALAVVLARVPGERAEIERRRDLPYRMMAARIRLANLAGAYKGREAALSAQLQAAEDWMTRLAECDPATVADVLAGGVRCRGQMAGLLETVGAPLPPDDLDTSTEGKRAALLEELTDDAWLAPADVPQGRPSTVVIR